ncbi:MAG: hypothetical protein RL563_2731 [Pseudomonadota bacterium]
MTTEATNKLQGLTGALNPALLSSGGAASTADAGAFTDTFTQQLQQLGSDLQQNANLNPESLTASIVNTPMTADAETLLQNFAAVFGNPLPSAKKIDQSINLDETLGTLNNVLQRLQSLEAANHPVELSPQTAIPIFEANPPVLSVSELPEQSESSSEAPPTSDSLFSALSSSADERLKDVKTPLMTDPILAHSPKQQTLESLPLAEEALSSPALISPLVSKGDKSPEEVKPLKEKTALKMTVADLAGGLIAEMPMVVSVDEEGAGLQVPTEQALGMGSMSSKESLVQESLLTAKSAINSSQEHGSIVLSQNGLQNSTPMTSSFEQNFNALLGLESPAETKAILESTPSGVNDKNTFLPLSENAIQSSDVGIEKSTFNFAGDVQKLNQTLSSQSSSPTTTMAKTMNDPAWQAELGDKLIWMHKQAVPSVELRLNPEHLGPVLIKIDVQNDQASVSFNAQHLAVKEAIEASIPKLREMLSGQQLQLTDVNVSQHQSEQRQGRDFYQAGEQGKNRQTQNDEALPQNVTNDSLDIMEEIEAGRAIASNGLLSLFA